MLDLSEQEEPGRGERLRTPETTGDRGDRFGVGCWPDPEHDRAAWSDEWKAQLRRDGRSCQSFRSCDVVKIGALLFCAAVHNAHIWKIT